MYFFVMLLIISTKGDVPILLYGCEVWGYENLKILDQFQVKFVKLILNLKASTPNCMIYGETGIRPISTSVKSRLLCYWSKILNSRNDKICKTLYDTVFSLHSNNIISSPWITFVKKTLDELGLSHYFANQYVENVNHFKSVVNTRLLDQFVQNWNASVNESPKCLVYRMYKHENSLEKYFDILPFNLAKVFCKFRTTNHSLPIEKGR